MTTLQPPLTPDEVLLPTREVARRLGVTMRTVELWIRAGRLPALRLGAHTVRIRERDLARFLERCAVGGDAA